MATGPTTRDVVTVEIFEVGLGLTKIEAFRIYLDQWEPRIKSFSPTTYRISILVGDKLRILDVRNPEYLLEGEGRFMSHCFSSDGSLFGAYLRESLCTWKYNSGRYTPWREFPTQDMFSSGLYPLEFSPTLSSIMCCSKGFLRVFHLDSPPTLVHPSRHAPIAVLSPCGTYPATAHKSERTVAITNPLSQTTSQFVDTDMEIRWLALTGNVLLVFDGEVIAAWRLAEEGLVDGVFGGRRAGRGDSIWVVSGPNFGFAVYGQTVIIAIAPDVKRVHGGGTVTIESDSDIHAYDTGTGEVLEPTQTPTLWHSYSYPYDFQDMYVGRHYLHYHGLGWEEVPSNGNWQVSRSSLREGWVKDPEGKCRLWIPIEWRDLSNSGWLPNITTLWFNSLFVGYSAVIIMF